MKRILDIFIKYMPFSRHHQFKIRLKIFIIFTLYISSTYIVRDFSSILWLYVPICDGMGDRSSILTFNNRHLLNCLRYFFNKIQ